MGDKGMTLIEIIFAIAIFAIASVMLVSGFLLVSDVFGESVNISRTGSELARRLETDADLTTSYGTISFIAGGKSFSINVVYKTATKDIGNGFTETRTLFGAVP